MPSLALAFDILAKDKASRALLDVGDAADHAGGRLSNLSGVGKTALAGLAGAGGLAAVALTEGFSQAMEQGASGDKLAAQLGLTPQQAEAFGRAAGDIYADAYGDSIGQVNDALGAVQSNFGDMLGPADDALEVTTKKALDLASAFDIDVADAAKRAGTLVRTGLAKDADEAFDLVVASMQQMTPELRDELSDATTEYSKFFADIGISGTEMLGLFAQADDIFELDKTGDAIKEFTIRATDMSALTTATFDTMGFDAEVMAGRLLAGGETARGAFEEIITGLYNIEDPVIRANSAIALFGTPLEDLGVNEIPAFLTQLGEMETGLGDVGGAASTLGDTLNDNAATKFETFKRTAMQGMIDFIGDNVIPEVEDLADAWGEDGFSGALDLLADEKLPVWLDDFGTWIEDEAIPAFSEAGAELGWAFMKGIAEGFGGELEESWKFLTEGMDLDVPLIDGIIGLDPKGFEPPGNASGTSNWRGGLSWVGEQGPELMNLPRGSQVFPHGKSQAMAGGFDAVGEDQVLLLREQNGILRSLLAMVSSSGGSMRGLQLELT